jgi:hypothetical protein
MLYRISSFQGLPWTSSLEKNLEASSSINFISIASDIQKFIHENTEILFGFHFMFYMFPLLVRSGMPIVHSSSFPPNSSLPLLYEFLAAAIYLSPPPFHTFQQASSELLVLWLTCLFFL